MERKELELYVHIPFCMKKCLYCDFLSAPADEETQREYVEALLREIRFFGERSSDYVVSTIYIGGGTPSWLDEALMAKIMEEITHRFLLAKDAEITIECNPGTVTERKFQTYKKIGINRLSIGLQSVNEKELQLLGRVHTFDQFLKTYELARKTGFTNINVDLMSSLPGQTPKTFANTLQQVIRLHPEHISAYSLIIEKGTPFYETYKFDAVKQRAGMQTEFLPTEDEEYEIGKLTQVVLEKAGYHRYEVSNYARQGFECKHNLGYWQGYDYIGIGNGAVGRVHQGKNLLNTFYHRRFEIITPNERAEELLIMGLRLRSGIEKKHFEKQCGIDFHSAVNKTFFEQFKKEGLLVENDTDIKATSAGNMVLNYIIEHLCGL